MDARKILNRWTVVLVVIGLIGVALLYRDFGITSMYVNVVGINIQTFCNLGDMFKIVRTGVGIDSMHFAIFICGCH